MTSPLSRREMLKALGLGAASLALPLPASAHAASGIVERIFSPERDDTDATRLA
jgi:hypothetical protein